MPVLNKIDHVHFYTKDRATAEAWYKDNLNFERVAEFESWIENGPLTLSNGGVHLALFESSTDKRGNVAFEVDASSLFNWIEHLQKKTIEFVLKDHTLSWSLYFTDTDGNSLEITTYECAKFRSLTQPKA